MKTNALSVAMGGRHAVSARCLKLVTVHSAPGEAPVNPRDTVSCSRICWAEVTESIFTSTCNIFLFTQRIHKVYVDVYGNTKQRRQLVTQRGPCCGPLPRARAVPSAGVPRMGVSLYRMFLLIFSKHTPITPQSHYRA